MNTSDTLADAAVTKAAGYLEGCGFRILDRGWRCADGEIGILAAERHTFVACEVKTRSGTRCSTPAGAVSRAKGRRLRRLAAQWLSEHGVRFDQVRIDVIGLASDGAGGFTVEHVRGAS